MDTLHGETTAQCGIGKFLGEIEHSLYMYTAGSVKNVQA